MYLYFNTDTNEEVHEYNSLDTNANLPYEYMDKYEVAKRMLTKVAMLHMMNLESGASSHQRSKRMRSLDYRQFGRRLRYKDHYSPHGAPKPHVSVSYNCCRI